MLLIRESSGELRVQNGEKKIKFSIGNVKLISKVIDGKFPDYKKIVPTKMIKN